MVQENFEVLSELIKNLEKCADKIEIFYNKKDTEKFNESKKEILYYKKNIDEALK